MDTSKKRSFMLAGALLSYPIGFAYIRYLGIVENYKNLMTPVLMVLFSLAFIAFNEIVIRGRRQKSSKKAYFWYAAMIVISLLHIFSPMRPFTLFAIHSIAVYSALVSNEAYLKSECDNLIVFDMINGYVIKPFTNFVGGFVDFAKSVSKKGEGAEKKPVNPVSIFIGIVMVMISIPLFFVATALLTEIDSAFSDFIDSVFDLIHIDSQLIVDLFLAIPCSMYLYGLVRGFATDDINKTHELGSKIDSVMDKFKSGSALASRIVGSMFVGLYLLFFLIGGTYFFGGFIGVVPGNLTAAQYARTGFFQLVAIMVINIFIYLMINTLGSKEDRASKYSKIMIASLMLESIIFAIISLSKLILYFNAFGYTDSRLFAIWWVIIIAIAAGLIIVNTLTGKNFLKLWIYTVVISYVAICLISLGNIAINGRYKSCWLYSYADRHVESITYTCYVDGNEVHSDTIEIDDGHIGYHQYKADIPDEDNVRVDVVIRTPEGDFRAADIKFGTDTLFIDDSFYEGEAAQ